MIHQADPAEQQVGPQSACTPTTATWQGSAHGGSSADHIDWTIDGDCNMTVAGGSLSQNYGYGYLPWQENGYQTKVTSLTISNSLQLKSGVDSMYYWFYGMSALKSFSAPDLNVSGISSMQRLFNYCNALENIDLHTWDTRNLQDVVYMFSDCSALVSVNLSGWDTRNITNTFCMFQEDGSLTSLDMSGWDTRNVTYMRGMFIGTSITSLNLSGWNTSKVTNMHNMFRGSSITSLDLSGWDTSNVTDASGIFGYTHLKRLRLGAGTATLASAVQEGAFPTSSYQTVYVEGAEQSATFPDGSVTYSLRHFQSNAPPAGVYSVTKPTWFGNAKRSIQYNHDDGTVGDYPRPCLDWDGTGTCTIAGDTGLTGSATRRLNWIDTDSNAYIPGDTLTQDGLLTVTPQWNPIPVPDVTDVTWPHDLGGGSRSIRATGTADLLRHDDTIPVRYTWTDATGMEQHKDVVATIDGGDWTADLTDAASLASIEAADLKGAGTKVTVTAQVKDAGGPTGLWSNGKEGNADMVAPAVTDVYATGDSTGGVAMSSDRSQAIIEPSDTITISWLDNTGNPISWPDGGGTTTTLTVTAGPGGHFSATKPLAVTGAKKVQYTLSDGINTSETFTKKITDPITAIPLTGGANQLWSKLLLILTAVMLIGATTTLRNRRNHSLRLVTTNGHTTPIPHGFTTSNHHHAANRHTMATRTTPPSPSTAPSHTKLHHTAKHTVHSPRHTK
ncbi:BspA family leucine-rich repeat surface protein [Bifidobacterium sp. ESL0790]|uniref:BspA family leucine-rich repeat surface protein n=1 Tax=Bifidobacterium sp. ESL0790 TaxID=2983233 RepID=UPI0023F823B2|nr:BspA family leucine-rich repeat surface protein [Bifidobacterium sp. ESL0790]WEV72742.1 BspA family leucine-rich repeat surface protein [Bifidobacterium sp. ESL0790]